MTEGSARGGVRFDMTINLGHIASVLMTVCAVVIGWMTMDARIAAAERDIKILQARDEVIAREGKEVAVGAETRLLTRITEQRAHMDQTQVRTADDIREIKTIMRDGFRDLDQKLERKVDKPGR